MFVGSNTDPHQVLGFLKYVVAIGTGLRYVGVTEFFLMIALSPSRMLGPRNLKSGGCICGRSTSTTPALVGPPGLRGRRGSP